MSDMNSTTTDSFSWNLEDLLIPEDINDLFIYSQQGSAQKPTLQVDSVTQKEPVDQPQLEQQQQLLPPLDNTTASFNPISVDISNSVDVEMVALPQEEQSSSDERKDDNNKPQGQSATSSSVDDSKAYAEKYLDRRKRNNLASRKSREKRKNKNHNVILEIEELSLDNERLKSKVKNLEESLEKVKAVLFASVVAKKTSG